MNPGSVFTIMQQALEVTVLLLAVLLLPALAVGLLDRTTLTAEDAEENQTVFDRIPPRPLR